MDSIRPFLEAIIAAPEDDTTRLVCADWLEEHGDNDRAEFIRSQCQLARLPAWERQHQELTWRTQALLARRGAQWRGELPVLEGVTWTDFERGFVSTVRVTNLAVVHRLADEIGQAAPVFRIELVRLEEEVAGQPPPSIPWLRTLRLNDPHLQEGDCVKSLLANVKEIEIVRLYEYGEITGLMRQSSLAALTGLKVEGNHTVGQPFAQQVAAAAWSTGLTRLDLGTSFIDYNSGYFEDPTLGAEGARILAGTERLRSLQALNLRRQRIGDPGLAAILQSPHLRGLRELELRANELSDLRPFQKATGEAIVCLDLSLNRVGDKGARALAGSERLARLEKLVLDTCEIGAEGLRALGSSRFWEHLCHLDVTRNPLNANGIWALQAAPSPARLHTLRLADCDLDYEAACALSAVPWLRRLLVLDLSANDLEQVGIAGLLLAGGSVRHLTLVNTRLTPTSIPELAPIWPQLVQLDLSENLIGNTGLAALASLGEAACLQSLRLRNCKLSRAGIDALCARPAFPHLHTLALAGNQLKDASIPTLLQSPLACQLQELDLQSCSINDAGARTLAESPALAGLTRLDLRNNSFGETALRMLAESPHLEPIPEILLAGCGQPWSMADPTTRELLARRFGDDWYWRNEPNEGDEEIDELA